jgi:hypothetical protein
MSPARISLILLAAHVAAAAYFVLDRAPGTAAALSGLPLDDAWIHAVYARSLAGLRGFAYNPGQLETGCTSPLWAMVLVPASLMARVFHISVVVPAKITGVLTAVFASLGAARLVRGLRLGWAAQLAAGLAIALDPSLAFAQVSGMEVMLAGALGLWAFAELSHERYFAAGLAAGLAPLARPEMALATLMVLAAALWRLRRVPGRAWIWLLLPTVAAVGGWVSYCLAVSGHPLPSTFYAKFAGHEEYLTSNLALIFGQILPALPWFGFGAGVVLWAVGAADLWRRGLAGRLFVVFPFAFFLGVSWSRLMTSAEAFFFLRYVLPGCLFVVAVFAVGAVCAVQWVWRRRRLPWTPAYAVGTALVLVAALGQLPRSLGKSADLFAWNCQNIDELNVAMALWQREHVPPGETIAVSDAGAARYFGEHRIFDMVGLNHHRYLHRQADAMAEIATIKFLSIFPSLMPHVRDSADWQPIHRTSTENLTICRCPQSEIVLYHRSTTSP